MSFLTWKMSFLMLEVVFSGWQDYIYPQQCFFNRLICYFFMP
jgi:hypothetical protein